MTRCIRIVESRSGLDVEAVLLDAKAPTNAAFLWDYLAEPRTIPAIHAMWTGPEISSPIPPDHLSEEIRGGSLPPENATLNPLPGDVVLAFVPRRMWGGAPEPIFDIGFFYGPGARLLFPIGWLAGSVVAQVRPQQLESLAVACGSIRRNGACEVVYSRGTAA
jgi:hypothetical protein